MKTRLPQSVCALVALAITALGGSSHASDIPVGFINASPGVVKVGTFPELDWQIKYPVKLDDLVKVSSPGTIIPKTDLDMKVRLLGAGVTLSYSNGSNLTFVHTEGYFSYNGGHWQKLFAGTNDDVDQSEVLKSQKVTAGKSIRFGGRYWHNSWSSFYSSNDGTQNVRVLKDGDSIPTTYDVANSPTLEQFIKPYLDAGGKVDIGPMDMIVMLELTHTDSQRYQSGYDLQDLVFLVTFSE